MTIVYLARNGNHSAGRDPPLPGTKASERDAPLGQLSWRGDRAAYVERVGRPLAAAGDRLRCTGEGHRRGCDRSRGLPRRDPWYQTALSSLRPDVIILVQPQRDEPRLDPVLRPNDPALGAPSLTERNAVTISGTLDLFARKVPQARIVLLEPLPIAPKPGPTTCLKTAGRLGDCAFVPTTSPPTELTLRALAGERPAVTTLDVDRLVCPDTSLCMPIVDGVVVWRDDGHLSHHFVDHMVEPFDRALVDTGAIRVS